MGVHAKCVTVAKKNHFDDEFYPLGKHFEDVPSTYEDDGKQRQKNAESPQSKIWSLSQQNPLNVLFFLFNLLLKVMRNKSFCSRKSLCECVCLFDLRDNLYQKKSCNPSGDLLTQLLCFISRGPIRYRIKWWRCGRCSGSAVVTMTKWRVQQIREEGEGDGRGRNNQGHCTVFKTKLKLCKCFFRR